MRRSSRLRNKLKHQLEDARDHDASSTTSSEVQNSCASDIDENRHICNPIIDFEINRNQNVSVKKLISKSTENNSDSDSDSVNKGFGNWDGELDEEVGIDQHQNLKSTVSNVLDEQELDNNEEHTTDRNQDIIEEKSVAELPKSKVSIFTLDFSKYKSSSSNQSNVTDLIKTSEKLKRRFPFRDHIKNLCGKNVGIDNVSNPDIFGLDSIQIKDSSLSDNLKPTPKLKTQFDVEELYFENNKTSVEKQKFKEREVDMLMKKSVLPDDLERRERAPKLYESERSKKLERKKKSNETSGKGWYNMPKTEVTEEVKRDLQLLKMRSALDTKHHYKRNDSNKLPQYFQIGTIVEGAHEFYSTRVSKKHRKRTMVEELLDDADCRRRNKKKLIELRKKQISGGKGYFKKMKNKRKPTWART